MMRLNRFLSMAGVCSRRKADEYIKKGFVKVNGQLIRELGTIIDPENDIVEFKNTILKAQKPIYLILNKPCCYLTALEDKEKPTIKELLKNVNVRVYPVGRLDYNTEGLLILTNDGELAKKIMHPKYKLPKTYVATVRGYIDDDLIKRMLKGVNLEDGFVKPDDIKLVKNLKNESIVEITFHEGKNHLVKRFFMAFGKPVKHLKRITIGPISLGELKKGQYRYLKPYEVKALKDALENG